MSTVLLDKDYSRPRRTVAIGSLLFVMCIWGSAFTITKATITEVPPVLLSLLRYALASVILVPLALRQRKQPQRLSRRAWLTMAAMGLCGFTLFQSAANIAQFYITVTQAALIQSVIPVATAVLAAFVLRERLSSKRSTGIILSLIGVGIVVLVAAPSERASNPLLGGAIMMIGIVSWAIYTILAKQLANIDSFTVTAYSTVFGTLFLVPPALVEGWGHALPTISTASWLNIAYLGAMSSAIASLLYNRSLVQFDASQTANFINLVPIIGVAVAVLFLGEPLIAWQLAGGAVALVGVWLTS